MSHTSVPVQTLNQIAEFSRAFVLITIDHEGELSVYDNVHSEADDLALDKFMTDMVRRKDAVDMAAFMKDIDEQ